MTPTRREEVEVSNERIPLRGEKHQIFDQEDVNELVPPPETQGPQVTQIPPLSRFPQDPYVDRDMNNEEIRAALEI